MQRLTVALISTIGISYGAHAAHWSLHIHTNLAILNFLVYYTYVEISVISAVFRIQQAMPILGQNPGDATELSDIVISEDLSITNFNDT